LLLGLKAARTHGFTSLDVLGDSQLICRQVSGEYNVNAPTLIPLHRKAMEIVRTFQAFSIKSIPRDGNKVADSLANEAMDRRSGRTYGIG